MQITAFLILLAEFRDILGTGLRSSISDDFAL
jgi:hypothetical protein